MKKNILKKAAAFISLSALTVGALAGCGQNNNQTTATTTAAATTTTQAEQSDQTEAPATSNDNLNGRILMVGSTSMEKYANALAELFMEENPGVTVTAEFVGSGAGIEAAITGTADIGNSSRALKDEEKANGAVENIVAIDGIAVIVDNANSVTNLTKDQLIGLYDGSIANWQDIGGDNQPVVVVGREAGSGTRGAFEELLKLEDECAYANELDSTGAVMAKVASTPGAIGYVSLDVINDTVTAVSLEDVEATEANIVAGDYILSRPFVMATNGEIGEQNELVQALFAYIYSEKGNELAELVGLIPAQ